MASITLRAELAQTALQTLAAGIGKDKTERHAFIVNQCAVIIALALCKAPPKGQGNPADHAKLAGTFAAAKMTNYAEHCAAFPQALKGRMRSVQDWAQAQDEGIKIAVAAFSGCAPKTYTAEQIKAREDKREAAKLERAKQDKADAKAAKELHAAELAQAEQHGRESVAVTESMVVDMVRAGSLSLSLILSGLGYDAAEVQAHPVGAVALAA